MQRILATLVISTLIGIVSSEAAPKFRFIYNSDGGNIFIYKKPPMTPEDVYRYVDEVAETSATSFFVCPNYCQPMMFRSEFTGLIGDDATEEQEKKIQEEGLEKNVSLERAILNLRGLIEQGHDPVGIILDRAKEKGLEAFLSFRLNEIHSVEKPEGLIITDFWREHPEWRVAEEGHEVGPIYAEIIGPRVHPIVSSWFWGGLNFAIPEVRARRLAQLRECCERYPQLDGLEIDFQRFPVYFKEGEEKDHIETMTEWMRQVREMVDEVSETRDKPILLTARIMATPKQNLGIGLDPFTWAKEGLIDFAVISHYLRNDYTLPVMEFREQMPKDFPLYASIEVEPKPENYIKLARELWDQKPDGIYLFNFFTSREGAKEPPFHIFNQIGHPEWIPESTE